jgi:AcrR family transcriptional regulator
MQASPAPSPSRSPRVERRRARTRARILDAAARRFAEAGYGGATLDDIAEIADVSRGTLYSLSPGKEAIVADLLRPVLERAARGVAALRSHTPRRAVDGLVALYLELWHAHADALRVSQRLRDAPLGELAPLHGRFLDGLVAALDRAARAGLLRSGDGTFAGRMLFEVAVPLLQLCSTRPDGDRLFFESVRGLLLRE